MENGTNDNESDNKQNIQLANRAENNGNKEGDSNVKTEDAAEDGQDECIVKMRGLPWSATVEDILSFLG